MQSCNFTDEQMAAMMGAVEAIDGDLTLQEVVDTLGDYLPPWVYTKMSPAELADYVIEVMYPWLKPEQDR